MRKTIALALTLSLFLLSCGQEDANMDLTGTWKTTSDSVRMEAVVQDQEIVMDWVEDEFKALYWKGSFPEVADSGSDILSIGDTEAMDASLMGSTDPDKTFVYEKGQLSFELTILGVVQTVYLEKVSDA